MSQRLRLLEKLALGTCAFILTQAVLSLLLTPGDTPTDGNPVWKLILGASYLSVVIILLVCYRETLFVVRRNGFLVALVVLALSSPLWAATPDLVFRRSIAVLGTTLLGIALAVRLSLEEQLRLLSWMLRIIAILSLLCVVFLPGYGISDMVENQGEWRGVFGHKNGLGSVMALSILVEWQLPVFSRFTMGAKSASIFLSFLLLVMSRSLTPMLALIGSLLFVGVYRLATQRLRIPLYAVVLAILLLGSSGVVAVLTNTDRIAGAVGRSSDLTGRTEIWSLVSSYIAERPILGYGYSGFWYGASPESVTIDRAMGTQIMYSHNGFLEITLTLGLVGVFLAVGFLRTGIKRVFAYSEDDRHGMVFWPLSFFCFFLLHNLGECTILFQDLEWAVCVATIVATDPALFTPYDEETELLPVASEGFT